MRRKSTLDKLLGQKFEIDEKLRRRLRLRAREDMMIEQDLESYWRIEAGGGRGRLLVRAGDAASILYFDDPSMDEQGDFINAPDDDPVEVGIRPGVFRGPKFSVVVEAYSTSVVLLMLRSSREVPPPRRGPRLRRQSRIG